MSGVGCPAYAACLPSGESEKPVTWTSPLVSWVALRLVASITHRRFHEYIWLGVQASSFSFSFFFRSSVLASFERKASSLLSCDHSSADTQPLASESIQASPPSGRISQIWRLASSVTPGLASSDLIPGRGRSERNAIVRPSGDQRGNSSATG